MLEHWDVAHQVKVPHFVYVCVCVRSMSVCIQQGSVEQTVNTVLWPISASSSGQRRLQKVTHTRTRAHAHMCTHFEIMNYDTVTSFGDL